ncbi:class I SAM-dependent methyltransferase [Mesorhizobium sp. KR1-2]|uniref:class I SAM-dependent methyltransferase n=1 Tax=Mesorhizobium sp. KR1-2 TaxID=3156609 RepID=UPI0032B461D0
MRREKVSLTREKETLLITLYGKALESRRADTLLGDCFADEAIGRIDYDFSRLEVDANLAASLAIRASTLDAWIRAFLAAHPDAIVLELGCGLDTRVFRIDPDDGVEWFDIDFPEVMELRRKLYPAHRSCRPIASSVTVPEWLAQVPRDRPAMVVAEGLTPYLTSEEGPRLVAWLVSHLGSGELICDVYSELGLKFVRLSPSFRATGAEIHWAIDDPHELELAAPGLTLIEDIPAYRPEHAARMDWSAGWIVLVWSFFPALRKIGRLLRFQF